MTITTTREIQRRQYRIAERDGAFFLSICWDASHKLNQPMEAQTYREPFPTLSAAQECAVHLPAAPTWFRTEDGWETETYICGSGGEALSFEELEAMRRLVVAPRKNNLRLLPRGVINGL